MTAQQAIVIHITSDTVSEWEMTLRNLQNFVRDSSVSTPPNQMQVVVNGPAVRFLLASSPDAFKVTAIATAGVTISVCANSLSLFDHDPNAVAEGVRTVTSGVAEVIRAQQHGHNYLKLP